MKIETLSFRNTSVRMKATAFRVAAAALLTVASLTAAAWAQGSGVLREGYVSQVKIAVWDAETRDELTQLTIGDTLEIAAGRPVTLRVFVPRGKGPGNQRHYLSARWRQWEGENHVELRDTDSGKGACTVVGTRAGGAELRYELLGDIQVERAFMAKGSVRLRVTGRASAATDERADEMAQRLFRGILMRDLPSGQRGEEWIRRFERGGYREVVDAAYEIADGRESQYTLPEEKRVGDRERLLAIYEHLLDLDEDEIDKYQWRDHLRMMGQGRVTDVVMDIVRSPEFRRVHGYQDGR